MRDPILHTHVEDRLPEGHPLLGLIVSCDGCNGMLNASYNECMQTWIESGRGNYCVRCFASIDGHDAMDDDWGLE